MSAPPLTHVPTPHEVHLVHPHNEEIMHLHYKLFISHYYIFSFTSTFGNSRWKEKHLENNGEKLWNCFLLFGIFIIMFFNINYSENDKNNCMTDFSRNRLIFCIWPLLCVEFEGMWFLEWWEECNFQEFQYLQPSSFCFSTFCMKLSLDRFLSLIASTIVKNDSAAVLWTLQRTLFDKYMEARCRA